MTDDHDPTTENRLVRALRARDAEVSPRGSLSDVNGRDVARSSWRRAPLVVAAALVLVGGIAAGVSLLGDDEDGQPDVAVDNPTTTVAPTTTTTEPTASSSTSTTTTTTTTVAPTPEWLADEGLIIWPRDSRSFGSMEQAASTYVEEHIGYEDATITYECCVDRTATARMKARGEGGRELDRNALTMTLVETDGTWDIVTVQSDLLTIDRVTPTPAGLVVAGRGTAFEGSAFIDSTSYCSPGRVAGDVIAVGSGPETDTPFSAFVAAPACDVAIVGVMAPGVADGATGDRAEVAVRVDAPEELVVMRVEADDVLNVRAAPDPGADIVATLDPDAAGISRTGETDGNWWEITTPDGTTGWADRAFLSVQYPLDDYPDAADLQRALIPLTQRVVQVLDQGWPEPPDEWPTIALGRSIDVGGIGVYADAPSQRRVDDGDLIDGAEFDWAPFPDDNCGDECSLTVEEFLDLRTEMLAEATYATNLVSYDPEAMPQYLIGLPELYTERFATVRVEIPSSTETELDWRTYSFVYDFSGELPQVIAIWRWGWTP